MVLPVSTSPASRESIPSRSNSLRNAGSRRTRARIVVLKLRVNGTEVASFLALLVVLPASDGGLDVSLLALFETTAQQQNQPVAILAKINAVARAEVQLVFENPGSNAFNVREVAMRHADHGSCRLGGRGSIQSVEPPRIRATARTVQIFSNLD